MLMPGRSHPLASCISAWQDVLPYSVGAKQGLDIPGRPRLSTGGVNSGNVGSLSVDSKSTIDRRTGRSGGAAAQGKGCIGRSIAQPNSWQFCLFRAWTCWIEGHATADETLQVRCHTQSVAELANGVELRWSVQYQRILWLVIIRGRDFAWVGLTVEISQ